MSGTFHSEKLNMEWAKQIQIIIEEKIRKSDNGIGKSVDLEHNVYNDIEGISSENQSINNRFTKEEIQATQKYLEGIKNGTIKGNIGEDFQVETDDYEMEHNILASQSVVEGQYSILFNRCGEVWIRFSLVIFSHSLTQKLPMVKNS